MIFLCSVLKGNSFEAWYKSGFPNLPAFLDLVGDVSQQTEIFDVLSFYFVFRSSLAKMQLLGEVSQKEE